MRSTEIIKTAHYHPRSIGLRAAPGVKWKNKFLGCYPGFERTIQRALMKTRLPLLLIVGYALLLASLSPADTVVEEIIARVNNEIVTHTEYIRSRDQLKQEIQQQDPANADRIFAEKQRDVLRDLIDQQLLLQKGKDLGVPGDAEVFAFLQQELLVDQIAQHVALLFGENAVGVGRVLLLNFLLELIAAADVFRVRNDFVVYPGDNLFDHGIGRRKRGEQQRVANNQQQGKSGLH